MGKIDIVVETQIRDNQTGEIKDLLLPFELKSGK